MTDIFVPNPKPPVRQRVLGLDVGGRRIGVAVSDALWLIASPVRFVERGQGDLAHLKQLVQEYDIGQIVVGLPTGLSGREGPQAAEVRAYATTMETVLDRPVIYWDERLTSTIAERSLIASGSRRSERRQQIDAVAAAVILQDFLDAERHRRARWEDGRR